MFERFTEKARRVVVLAQDESRELAHDHIGTEHLLLALIREEDGIAGKALAEAGITLDEARKQVEVLVPQGEPEPKRRSGKRWRRHVDFTTRAKKTMELSLRESLGLGHNYIGTEHLLLGLLSLGEGAGIETLTTLSADPGQLRDNLLKIMRASESNQLMEGLKSVVQAEPEVEVGVTMPPGEAASPTCPKCHSDLAETAAVRTLDLPMHEVGETRAVTFAFCRRCGSWLGTVAG
jgi:ATP-dependent Clp protease ATP-binding subunit ClpA